MVIDDSICNNWSERWKKRWEELEQRTGICVLTSVLKCNYGFAFVFSTLWFCSQLFTSQRFCPKSTVKTGANTQRLGEKSQWHENSWGKIIKLEKWELNIIALQSKSKITKNPREKVPLRTCTHGQHASQMQDMPLSPWILSFSLVSLLRQAHMPPR
jgi:hypothetical protein